MWLNTPASALTDTNICTHRDTRTDTRMSGRTDTRTDRRADSRYPPPKKKKKKKKTKHSFCGGIMNEAFIEYVLILCGIKVFVTATLILKTDLNANGKSDRHFQSDIKVNIVCTKQNYITTIGNSILNVDSIMANRSNCGKKSIFLRTVTLTLPLRTIYRCWRFHLFSRKCRVTSVCTHMQ